MTSQPNAVKPPPVAVWLIRLFILSEEAESILGDLLEEFSALASKSGVPLARNWYWRQTIKTVPCLTGFSLRAAPWMTVAAVAGGYALRKLVAPRVGPATFGVLERWHVFFGRHFGAYLFFASTGLDIEHLITFLLIGFVVAFAAKEREIVATTMLAIIFGAIALAGSIYGATRTGNYMLLWRLTWYFADSFAVVVAGAIVRMHRLAAESRPSAA